MSYVEIGNKVNLSRVAVSNRIKAMEEQGIIEQYSIVINPHKIGRMISAFFDLEVRPRYLYSVANQLADEDSVTNIYQMTGVSNLHVHAIFSSNEEFDNFLKNTLYKLPGIEKIDSQFIISRIKVREGIRL